MKLYLDCEYNDFRGPLISMGIVTEDGRTFYASVGCENPSPWVAEHVMPVIDRTPISAYQLTQDLGFFLYLLRCDEVTVIADWPEDIKHFCDALIVGPGMAIPTPAITFELRRDLDTKASAIPHNALYDAIALKEAAEAA